MAASFVELHLKWTARHMAPARYHLFSALTVAAHAMGRRVWLNRDAKKATFPAQMMTLLIGPSGLKKTTAADFALGNLRKAKLALPTDEATRINIMSSRMSTEALWTDIIPTDGAGFRVNRENVDAVGLLEASELAATFGQASYMEGMSTAVTRLNDAPTGTFNWTDGCFDPGYIEMSFKKDGPERTILRNPCVGMLGCVTPDGLADEMPMHIRTTGFLARVLPVWEIYASRPMNLLLGPGRREDDESARLIEMLAEFAMLSGEARVEPKAEVLLAAHWGEGEVRKYRGEPMLDAFMEREQDHTHRIAKVFAADETLQQGRTGHQKVIWMLEEHYLQALKLVEVCKEKLLDCYAPMGRKHANGLNQYILHLMQGRQRKLKEPAMSVWRLRRKVYTWSKGAVKTLELFHALDELTELGKIFLDGPRGRTQRAVLRAIRPGPWSGTPARVDRAFVAAVNRQLAEDAPDDEWDEEYSLLAAEQRRRDRGDDDAD
jgi:hypothetical protein